MVGKYDSDDKVIMQRAAAAKNKSRVQELIDFAKASGFTRLGIANCKGVQMYADYLADMLTKAGFDVFRINCKESGLQGCDICEDMAGPCCDPLSQAEYLNEMQTDLNINVGLCLGHGLLFQRYSKAEVTTILVKDFAHNHNMGVALSSDKTV